MTLSKESNPSKIYFENLNAIRLIAALLVVVHHVEQLKSIFNLPNYWDNRVISIFGRLGVVLFFVLSGFLITYLLLKEQEITKTISIKNFYIRRILRIWPLYFLIVFSSLFVFPFIKALSWPGVDIHTVFTNIFWKTFMYIAFLPNLVLILYGIVPFASQTWSIGAEEQFYLIWPFLNKKVGNKWVLLFSVIFIYLVIKIVPLFLPGNTETYLFHLFWESMPIDCMAIGGIFALILHETSDFTLFVRKILFHKVFQWLVLIVTLVLVARAFTLPFNLHYELFSVLFGILICNFAANKNRIFSMEYPITVYLGKISYGLYMYHPLAITICIKLLMAFGIFSNLLLYPMSLLLLVAMSGASYRFMENRFITKKIKYSKVISGDPAHDGVNK